ncbi:hypothetical protein A2U01_0059097, partial [Trifolium medium]|nr:hypothetical protein [Trifolium medium]
MEKTAKNCKILAVWGARRNTLGRKAQPSALVLLFAVCCLRNARAGLRIAH